MTNNILTEIDLSKTTCKGGNGLEVGPTYVILYDGKWYKGKFEMQWYGLNFCGIYDAGAQYNPPHENYSSYQKMYLVANDPKLKKRSADALLIMAGLDPDQIAADEELPYAKRCRDYAIKFHMTNNGQTITEAAPIEAFMYDPKVPAMPPLEQDDD